MKFLEANRPSVSLAIHAGRSEDINLGLDLAGGQVGMDRFQNGTKLFHGCIRIRILSKSMLGSEHAYEQRKQHPVSYELAHEFLQEDM